MRPDQIGFIESTLMSGERIYSMLNMAHEHSKDPNNHHDVVLLTNERVIRLHSNRRSRKAVFASIHAIDTVEVAKERAGSSAFIWAAVAFFVAASLYFVIDHAIARVAAAATLALMGLYLIADRLLDHGNPVIIFKTGSSQLRCDVGREQLDPEVYSFINQLFSLKLQDFTSGNLRARRFAPR